MKTCLLFLKTRRSKKEKKEHSPEGGFFLPIYLSILLCFSAMISACSLNPGTSQGYSIKISFPEAATATMANRSAANVNGTNFAAKNRSFTALPATFDQFTCFGASVTATDISTDSRWQCPAAAGTTPGLIAGLAPLKGDTIELMVPSGPKRNIQVFALQSVAGCPSLNDLLNKPAAQRFNGVDPFYVLGSTIVDVYQDQSVNIKVSYNSAAPQKYLAGCAGQDQAPASALDINGNVRLVKNSAQPAACAASNDGTLAMTSGYITCVCKNDTGWVQTSDGATPCNWTSTGTTTISNAATIGGACSVATGTLAQNSSGLVLSCQNGYWTSQSLAPQISVLTSGSGTYTTPTGAKYLTVKMVGGGAGGGAGGYLEATITSPATSYSYSIGTGGSAREQQELRDTLVVLGRLG